MSEGTGCEYDEQVSAWMSLALDGMLDPENRRTMDQHLATCPICLAEWNAMGRMSAMLEGVITVGPPLGFAERVERRIANKSRNRRRLFGGAAALTSILSLAALTAGVIVLIVLGALAWRWLGSQPAVHQGVSVLAKVASGLVQTGKAASLFFEDLLLRYGLLLLLALAGGLALLVGLWAGVFRRGRRGSEGNGYAQ